MARLHPDFEGIMVQLNRYVPDRELLTIEEVMKITGYKTRDSVKKHYPFPGTRISKVKLARLMCQ